MNAVRWVVLGIAVVGAVVIAAIFFLALGLFFGVSHVGGGTVGPPPLVTGTIAPATASASP